MIWSVYAGFLVSLPNFSMRFLAAQSPTSPDAWSIDVRW